jgi:hypothetical protein
LLLRLLATTANPESITQVLRLVSYRVAGSRNLDRYVASLLASGQRTIDLAVAFREKASEELRACLVHELVLRGAAVTEIPKIAEWAMSPHWRYHPLGWLPLTLSEVEEQPSLPSYSTWGSSYPMPYGPSDGRGMAVIRGTRVPVAVEATAPERATTMGRAVANWAEDSNGVVEARIFDLSEPMDTEALPSTLLALGLECLDGVKKGKFSVTACPPAQAWRVLFAAASSGGAYNSGARGAYGRLAAWQSLAGLVGAADGVGADQVEAQVRDCFWYTFDADSKWFERVAWDIGLVAVAPDRRRLAVLAATDTD